MLAAWHLWALAGLLLWIVEIFTPGFVLGLIGTACLLTVPFAAAGAPLWLQLAAFGLATAVLALAVRPLVLRLLHRRGAQTATNVDALIGRAGQVTEGIDRDRGTGRVRIGGESWSASAGAGPPLEAGRKVVVRRVEGNKVIVESYNEEEPK